jgi:antitoxin (DNA-binding transcriptional repressor) of toxin-antitoxin stability system
MREIGVLDLKTNLSALLTELEKSGETVAITRNGHVIAQLVPQVRKRRFMTKESIDEHLRWLERTGREAEERGVAPITWEELRDGFRK